MITIAKPPIGDEERAAVDRVLRSGLLAQGPEVEQFEHEFSKLVDGRHCVAVNSGTSALHLCLLVAGIQPGDEVIVPSMTFAATANAVRLVGAVPVFVDIEPVHFCIDPAAVEAAITPRTTAVIPVHLYGHMAAMRAITELAVRHHLLVVEDAAQAHAASLDGRPAGAWGTAAAFSFYPTKNMTTGEGGMLVTDDAAMARTARLLRNQGMERQYDNEIAGYNLRMTDIAAAIGRVQLRRLPDMTDRRRENAARYCELIQSVTLPREAEGVRHVYHQFTVRTKERDALQQRLAAADIESRVYYPVPVHRLPAYGEDRPLEHSDRAAAEVLSLPVGPHVTLAQVEAIAAVVG